MLWLVGDLAAVVVVGDRGEISYTSGMVACDYGTRLSDRSERVRARLTVERAEPWIDGVRLDPAT
jgi:hypothetical protein